MSRLLVEGRSVLDDLGLIIFDKDGTLIDVHHYWVSMIKLRARKAVDRWLSGASEQDRAFLSLQDVMGVDLETGRLKPEGPVGIKPRRFIIEVVTNELARYSVSKTAEEIEAVFREVDLNTAKDLAPLLKPLPDVGRFLAECYEAGIALAIATTDITPRAQEALRVLGLERFFTYVVGSDQVKRAKPSPDLGQLILERSGIFAQRAVMVGDHRVDVEMGINAGIGCNLGVLTGLGTPADFQALECHVIPSFVSLGVG